jgi:AraC-like DNA-binding protein
MLWYSTRRIWNCPLSRITPICSRLSHRNLRRSRLSNSRTRLLRSKQKALKQLLAGQRPGIQDLARELHLSTRTLQRRLTEQGITFQRLLDEARRELARHYLLHSSRELNETAYLLGYEDANSFFRAFHHWEGTSPGQWRLLQKTSLPRSQAQGGKHGKHHGRLEKEISIDKRPYRH